MLTNLILKVSTEERERQAPLIALLQKYKRHTEAISKYPMKYSQTSTIFQSIELPVQKAQVCYQATLNQHLQFLVNRTFVLRSI